jgi:DUF1365 family protein
MSLFFVYLDLDELPGVFDRRLFWSARRWAPAWFRRADYLGDPATDLREAVRKEVQRQAGFRPEGPIRMLTHLRQWGYSFNPVTFYYCFDADERMEAVVAEITNTPWKERCAYVCDCRGTEGPLRFAFDKRFHISPFMSMAQRHEWAFGAPGARLGVHMRNIEGGERMFDATLALTRRALTRWNCARALVRFPAMSLMVIARIHFEALRLWVKRVPVFAHPARSGQTNPVGVHGS